MTNSRPRPKTPRAGGVADLREPKPRGAGQFAAIVRTNTADSPPAKRSRKAPAIEGFTAKDIKELKETEKRYAASRKAATASGRDTLYE